MDLPTILRSAGARERFDGRKPPALHVPQALPPSAFRLPPSAFRIPPSAFRIPHSAFRIPRACFTLKKIRNRAAHTLFDSFATAPFKRSSVKETQSLLAIARKLHPSSSAPQITP